MGVCDIKSSSSAASTIRRCSSSEEICQVSTSQKSPDCSTYELVIRSTWILMFHYYEISCETVNILTILIYNLLQYTPRSCSFIDTSPIHALDIKLNSSQTLAEDLICLLNLGPDVWNRINNTTEKKQCLLGLYLTIPMIPYFRSLLMYIVSETR